MDDAEPFQGEEGIDYVDRVGTGDDQTYGSAGSDDTGFLVKLALNFRHHAIDQASKAMDRSGMNALDGGFSNDVSWVSQFHARQLGGIFEQGVQGQLNARRNGSTQVFSLAGNHVEGNGCTEIDNDEGTAIFLIGRHGIYDTVGSNLGWIVIEDGNPGLDAWPHNERLTGKVFTAHFLKDRNQRRYNTGDHDLVDGFSLHIVELYELLDEHPVLVGRAGPLSADTPVGQQFAVGEQTDDIIGITNVYRKQHGRRSKPGKATTEYRVEVIENEKTVSNPVSIDNR